MTSSSLHRTLTATAADLTYLSSCIHEVHAELATKITDLRGIAYDGTAVTAGVSDPTGDAALAPNPARRDFEQLRKAIITARKALYLAAHHRHEPPAIFTRDPETKPATHDRRG